MNAMININLYSFDSYGLVALMDATIGIDNSTYKKADKALLLVNRMSVSSELGFRQCLVLDGELEAAKELEAVQLIN